MTLLVATSPGPARQPAATGSHTNVESEAKAWPLVATMKHDGTLEGELSTNRGRTKWIGERLKPR